MQTARRGCLSVRRHNSNERTRANDENCVCKSCLEVLERRQLLSHLAVTPTDDLAELARRGSKTTVVVGSVGGHLVAPLYYAGSGVLPVLGAVQFENFDSLLTGKRRNGLPVGPETSAGTLNFKVVRKDGRDPLELTLENGTGMRTRDGAAGKAQRQTHRLR